MTFEYLLEPFLVRYFLLDALCSSFLNEQQRDALFFELARVFCLPREGQLEAYHQLVKLPHFQEIDDLASYERLCRTIEFAELTGQDAELTQQDQLILAQKRKAMNIKAQLFPQGKNLTRETVMSGLIVKAENGSIDAMTAQAYMEYHGFFGCADREHGLRRARLCARWNDLFGNLLCIAYGAEDPQSYYDTLFTMLRGAGEQPVFRHICTLTNWTNPCRRRPEARLMEKAFGMEIIKRGAYDRLFAQAAFSGLLCPEDKEKLLLGPQRELIGTLPLDLRSGNGLCFRENCAEALPLHREEEVRRILQNFAVARYCPVDVYKPLLITASEDYPVQMYGRMLKEALQDTAVVELDAGTLTDADFACTADNVFLRGLNETRVATTVFLIRDCQELSEGHAEALCKLLDRDFCRKFKLFQPAVSLDLSQLRFVLLASGKTAGVRKLADCCDTVGVSRIRPEEKAGVVTDIFHNRALAYGRENLTLEAEGQDYLTQLDIRQATAILDSAIRGAVFDGSERITLEALQQANRSDSVTPVRREFGYTGGKCHA